MKRVLWLLFYRPLVITAGVIVLLLIIWHLRLGDKSPGFITLMQWGMQYYIPLLVILFFVAPSIIGLWRIAQFRAQARSRGLTLSSYIAQSKEGNLARDYARWLP